MADQADIAGEHMEREHEALMLRNRITQPTITSSSHCLHCGQKLQNVIRKPRRWCDADCRDDWDHARRAQVRVG